MDLYDDDGTMWSGGSKHGINKEPADREDQKHGEVVKESMRMREGYLYKRYTFAFKDVRLDRGTSFTLCEAVVIGPRSEKRLAIEPENYDNYVPVLTAV